MSGRAVVLLEGDTGQKLASTEILAGGLFVAESLEFLVTVLDVGAAINLSAGTPSDALAFPAVALDGFASALLELNLTVESVDVAAGVQQLSIKFDWGLASKTIVVPVEMINGTLQQRLTGTIVVPAPAVAGALALTFTAAGLAGAQQINIAASANNYTVLRRAGQVLAAAWA